MLVAALLVIPVIAIEQSEAGEPWRHIAGAVNWAIWIAFAVELVVMMVIVPHRWGWLRAHPLEVVIVLLTPPFLPSSLQALRALRVLRCFGYSDSRSSPDRRSRSTASATPLSWPR